MPCTLLLAAPAPAPSVTAHANGPPSVFPPEPELLADPELLPELDAEPELDPEPDPELLEPPELEPLELLPPRAVVATERRKEGRDGEKRGQNESNG
jgi:hypothetical protein